jgi:Protein of unknown function (DUF1153)
MSICVDICLSVSVYVGSTAAKDGKMALLGLDLPPTDTVRWSPQRKASVVSGVRTGAISLDEACQRYQLSADEFLSWQRAVEGHGVGALRVTRLQYYRAENRLRRGAGGMSGPASFASLKR